MPIKKIRFLWNNLFDEGTVTASSEASGFPVSNLKQRWHTRCWRSTGLANEWVKNDLGEAKDIWGIVIKYHNFQSGATVKIQANATDAWGAPSFEETLTITTDIIVKLWEAAKTYRWWRLLMTDAGNPDGYLKFGRPYIGGFFQPTYDVTRPPHHIPIDPSLKLYSTGGQASVDERTHYEKISFEWDMIPDADKTIFKSIFAHVGKSKPYFICRDPDDAADTTFYVQNLSDFDFVPKIHGWYELYINVETMR